VADTGSRPAAAGGSMEAMDRPKFVEHPEPNIVLRGGPLDGYRTHVHNWMPATLEAGDQQCVYRPTGELDTEYPTLSVYVFDHVVGGG
jgi:hypothetical protein